MGQLQRKRPSAKTWDFMVGSHETTLRDLVQKPGWRWQPGYEYRIVDNFETVVFHITCHVDQLET